MKKIAMLAVFAAALFAAGCNSSSSGGTSGGTTGGKPEEKMEGYVGLFKADARVLLADLEKHVADTRAAAEKGDASAKTALPTLESTLADAKKQVETFTIEIKSDKTWLMTIPEQGAVSGTYTAAENTLTLTPTKFDIPQDKEITPEQKEPQVVVYNPAEKTLKSEKGGPNDPVFVKAE